MRSTLLFLAVLALDAQQLAPPVSDPGAAANFTHIWGRITSVSGNTFGVDQNFNADPKSAYRRQQRQIIFDAKTRFESSAPQDLRTGRTVDIIALKLAGSEAQATRITVYEGNKPTRMPAGARVMAPDGTVH